MSCQSTCRAKWRAAIPKEIFIPLCYQQPLKQIEHWAYSLFFRRSTQWKCHPLPSRSIRPDENSRTKSEWGPTKSHTHENCEETAGARYWLKINSLLRITSEIYPVRRDETLVAILTYLLALLSSLQIPVKYLCLDRGFHSVPIIRWLIALNIPLMMPGSSSRKA